MKKNLIFSICFLVLVCPSFLHGQGVTIDMAIRAANQYYQLINTDTTRSSFKRITPQITANKNRTTERFSPHGKAYMWFVPVADGWVLVSGNTKATPILAHIQCSQVPIYDSLPPAMQELLSTYEDYIAYVAEHSPEGQADNKWNNIINTESLLPRESMTSITEVGPLLSVLWGQSGGGSCVSNKIYNKFCPTVSSTNRCGKAPAGCVAVAIAQIMWYWKWPYSALVPTTVGGDISEIKYYDWDKMPTHIDNYTPMDEVNMVAGFLRDCGYKLDMDYGIDGSYAFDDDAVSTLVAFGYDDNSIELRSKWNTSGWTDMLRTSIDNGQPVYYSGMKKLVGKGHAFVVDGYRTGPYSTYHINWGWHNDTINGWYNIDEAYINDTLHYEHLQKAIFGIKPAPNCNAFTLDGSAYPLHFSENFSLVVGNDITLSGVTVDSALIGEIYSSSQIRLLPGVSIKQGSSVHIAIKDVPCQTSVSSAPAHMFTKSKIVLECDSIVDFYIQPNPVKDILTISNANELEQVTIYSLSGQPVLQTTKTEIDVSALPQGMYIVRAITVDGEQLQSKFIKQ